MEKCLCNYFKVIWDSADNYIANVLNFFDCLLLSALFWINISDSNFFDTSQTTFLETRNLSDSYVWPSTSLLTSKIHYSRSNVWCKWIESRNTLKKGLCPPIWTNLEVFSVVKSQTIAPKSFKGLLGNYFDHFQAVDKQKGYPIDD